MENFVSLSADHLKIMRALGKSSTFDSVFKSSTNGNQRKSIIMSEVQFVPLLCMCIKLLHGIRLLVSACTRQYRWILARYDVDVLDYDTKQAVVDNAPLNERVDIEFDYSRKEVEVCCEGMHACLYTMQLMYTAWIVYEL